MTDVDALASVWSGLALVATLLSIWPRVATAMSEIIVGTVARLFLAGIELDPDQLRRNWKEASVICLVGFFVFAASRGRAMLRAC